MKKIKITTRADGRKEWTCKHGVGHTIFVPEIYRDQEAWWMHGCCGCCSVVEFLEYPKNGRNNKIVFMIDGWPICQHCTQPMKRVKDTKTGKMSKYEYACTCKGWPSNMKLCIG
jgi:hypothetical protein